MELNLPFNTVLLLIGPTNSGKSYFTSLLPERAVVISSDQCRREVIGENLHKYHPRMLQASKAAFEVLKAKMIASMSFPMSLRTGLVVIDSTALNDVFRGEIAELCKGMQWNLAALVFDYKKGIPEYERLCLDKNLNRELITSQLTKLRTKVRPTLRKSDFTAGVFIVNSKDEINSISITQPMSNSRSKSILASVEQDKSYFVIGDVHGCYDELCSLLSKAGFDCSSGSIKPVKPVADYLVLVGDLVDKGPDNKKVVDLIYNTIKENPSLLIPILGNHELFFHEWALGNKKDYSEEKRKNYYNSTFEFDEDSSYLSKMLFIYSESLPYFFTDHFIVTHAPCHNKYLGKDDSKSISRMINLKFDRYKGEGSFTDFCKEMSDKTLSFVKESAENWPLIISGHVQVDKAKRVGSYVFIDTGAVYGNKLTGVLINDKGKHSYISVDSKKYLEDYLFSIFERSPLENIELTVQEKRKLRMMTGKFPVNFISGTISPSPSDWDNLSLESVESALTLYKNNNQEDIVLQTKFMGSRAQFYMVRGTKSDERKGVYQVGNFYCYWVSRGGYLINHADLSQLSKKMVDIFGTDTIELVVLDGELCPWSVLGSGLISDTYMTAFYEGEEQIKNLRDIGAEKGIASLREHAMSLGFAKLSSEERMKILKPHEIESLEASLRLSKVLEPVDVLESNLALFKEQIDLFGATSKPTFHPFSVLKTKEIGGKEEVLPGDNFLDGSLLGEENCIQIKVNEVEKAINFMKEKESQNAEGIVIKPLSYDSPIPAIKVRNENYLTLVYGPNYRSKNLYQKHVEKKKIWGKVKSSQEQWKLAKRLLSIPYDQISTSQEAKEIIFCFIQEERKDMDPRL